MGKGEPGGRQGFVSLSVGNQVSGPVGRPLSISVLLAVQLAVPRASRVISRALALPSPPPLSLSLTASMHSSLFPPRCSRVSVSPSRFCTADIVVRTCIRKRYFSNSFRELLVERERERRKKGKVYDGRIKYTDAKSQNVAECTSRERKKVGCGREGKSPDRRQSHRASSVANECTERYTRGSQKGLTERSERG